ncbi:MAG: 3-hydroxyacyl-CoA dehydrogenase, partial [Burkholderiaceae bacterium]
GLGLHAIDPTRLAEGLAESAAERVLRALVAQGRTGRAAGAGFYDYPAGAPKHLWDGLAALAKSASPLPARHTPADSEALVQEVADRLLYVQAIDSVRCLEEGVVDHARDANLGSILGIGFPPWTGGTLQFINGVGLAAFIERAEQLAARYGERFSPPPLLRQMAARQQSF